MMATPLDRLTDFSIPRQAQWEARYAICRHVRGEGSVGPRWRKGSNSWRPNDLETFINPDLPITPCPNCGADGGDLIGSDGEEYCASCREPFLVGDYAWTSLADCLRYRQDLAEDRVERAEDLACYRCQRLLTGIVEDLMAGRGLQCAEAACHLRYVPPPVPAIPRLSAAAKAALIALSTAPGRVEGSRTITALIKRGFVRQVDAHGRSSRPIYWLTKSGRPVADHLAILAGARQPEQDWRVPA